MRIDNVNQIRSEDYPEEYEDLLDQLGETINPFMQQVQELSDGRVDFPNRVEVLRTIEITVDSNGNPVLNNRINAEKTGVRGISVIRAINLTNNTVFPTSHPFVSFTPVGGDIIQINNITGLPANQRFRLTLVIY